MSENNMDLMDKCPIDGNFFEGGNGRKYCSTKCKRLADSQHRRMKKELEKQSAERDAAEAQAKKEARNAARRKARAEGRQVQYETPEEASNWLKPKLSRSQIIITIIFIVGVLLLIWGLPNGK